MLYRNLENLILASASPRRREMLASMGLDFQVVPSGVDESLENENGDPSALVCRWAAAKAVHVARGLPAAWVLAADTVVALDGLVFGKPVDESDAFRMLSELSGKTHRVFSGMTLVHRGQGVHKERVVCTHVTFRKLSAEEIAAYVRTGEPFDKAGGYGIQGLGAFLAQSIAGSYTNVVGLPLGETLDWLLEAKVIEPRSVDGFPYPQQERNE
jgi:septum formation protein